MDNEKLYYAIKALSFEEKMVLFLLYSEIKKVTQIAIEMEKDRSTISRIKKKAFEKIIESLIGGIENV